MGSRQQIGANVYRAWRSCSPYCYRDWCRICQRAL